MQTSFYMVVEHFKDRNAIPVYRRFRDHGRMMPDGLNYVASWVDENLQQCFQLMETANSSLLEQWMMKWKDVIDFEVYPVMTSKEASDKIAPKL